MTLQRAFVGCRIIETAQNYERADLPLHTKPEERPETGGRGYYDDRQFWYEILQDPEESWGLTYWIDVAAVSEWVARVPGLFWKPESEQFRELSPQAVEYQSQAWVTYTPWGKSQKVMGGIGTLRFAPGLDGYRLVSLTTTCNVSAGVPALVSPEVWDHHRLKEGIPIGGEARWQPMARGWSSYFSSTRGVPRGYLVLNDPDRVQVRDPDHRAPTLVHPFTIMEYDQAGVELFDYVYAAADTGEPQYRQRLERFFDGYKERQERYGQYLLAGDMISALWDARFESPEDLRRADATAGSQLSILEARVRERHLGQDTIERLLEALSAACDSADELKQMSDEAGIDPNTWYADGPVAEVCNQLVDAALERKRVAALVEVIATHYPKLFQQEEKGG